MDEHKVADAPARAFRNILLATAERMIYNAHNYWFVLVSDVASAVGFLIFGIRHLSGSTTAAGLSVTGGFIAWGFRVRAPSVVPAWPTVDREARSRAASRR